MSNYQLQPLQIVWHMIQGLLHFEVGGRGEEKGEEATVRFCRSPGLRKALTGSCCAPLSRQGRRAGKWHNSTYPFGTGKKSHLASFNVSVLQFL
ncbi:hypothetical protein GN956_G10569 [Arapaima gigas]